MILVLAGSAIMGLEPSAVEMSWGWQTPGADYPRNASATGIANAPALPPDFALGRYSWVAGALVRLPDEPPPPPAVPQTITPLQARRWLTAQLYLQRKTEQWEQWAIEEASMHDWRAVLEAGRAIGSFSSREWITDVDVPTSVVITMRDRVIPVRRQVRLFESIEGAEAFRVDGDHDAVVAESERFIATLLRAAHSVVERGRTPSIELDADLPDRPGLPDVPDATFS